MLLPPSRLLLVGTERSYMCKYFLGSVSEQQSLTVETEAVTKAPSASYSTTQQRLLLPQKVEHHGSSASCGRA